MKPIPQKFITAGFWTLVISTVLAIISFSVIRYGDAREQFGVEKAVRAYEGGIVRLEYPDRMYMTGKDMRDVSLHFGIFTKIQVTQDEEHFVLDEDEELPIAATPLPPKP